MILARLRFVWLGGMLACCAAQVQADVLEIGAEGARWIAGPQAIAPTPGGGVVTAGFRF